MASSWSDKHLEESQEIIIERILELMQSDMDDEAFEWISTASIHAHRWRFARPKMIPKEVDIERICFAGDAWSKPLGTIEAAIDSAKWSVAELLFKLKLTTQDKKSHQITLF
jgi:predicted NAD/FAD-dependent oxidoreductase